MRKTLKRMTAIMLSLLMVLGCVPNFINDSCAKEPSGMYLRMKVGGDYSTAIPKGTTSSNVSFVLQDTNDYYPNSTTSATSIEGWSNATLNTLGLETVTVKVPSTSIVTIEGFTEDDSSFSNQVGHYFISGDAGNYEITFKTTVRVSDPNPTSLSFHMDPIVVGEEAPYTVSVDNYDFNFGFVYGSSMEDCMFFYGDDSQGWWDHAQYLKNAPYSSPIIVEEGKYAVSIKLFEAQNKASFANVNTVTLNGVSLTKYPSDKRDAIRGGLLQGFTYSDQHKEIVLCMGYDFTGPKTPLTSASLAGEGLLFAGKKSDSQTLKWVEPDGANFISNDTESSTWYTDEACTAAVDSETVFVRGTSYYKKVSLTPKSGYEFKNITNVPVTNGTFVSVTPNGKKLDVVIEAKAENIITIDYDLSTYTKFNAANAASVTSTWANLTFDKPILNAFVFSNDYPYQFIAREELQFADLTELQSVDKIVLNGNNIFDANHKTTNVKADIINNKILYEIDETNFKITVHEKFNYAKSGEVTITTLPGKTITDVANSIVKNFEGNFLTIQAKEIVEGVIPAEILPDNTVLEAGKTYRVDMKFTDVNEVKTYTATKCNNVSLPKEETIYNVLNGYHTNVDPNNVYTIVYTFECKSQSSGGRKKKKVEEPKEDPKTPEEILKEELLKDDVKKADSKEGEKINPSAKYIKGYDDGLFRSERKVNNIEFMSMVTELFENVDIKETKDLNQGKDYWGQEIIDKANALGLVPGNKDDKNYNVTSEVSRGDLAVVIYNLIKDYTTSPSLSTRNNCKDAIGKDYETAVTKLVDLGILKGYDDGMFHGDYTLTRAEAVVVINRALKSLGFEINIPKITLSFPDLTPDHWAYAEIMYAANK